MLRVSAEAIRLHSRRSHAFRDCATSQTYSHKWHIKILEGCCLCHKSDVHLFGPTPHQSYIRSVIAAVVATGFPHGGPDLDGPAAEVSTLEALKGIGSTKGLGEHHETVTL